MKRGIDREFLRKWWGAVCLATRLAIRDRGWRLLALALVMIGVGAVHLHRGRPRSVMGEGEFRTYFPMVYRLPPTWRGVAVAWQWPGGLHNMGGWWYDYRHRPAQLVDPSFVPMIWSYPEPDLVALAQQFPGRYWLIFNEPDNAGQANLAWRAAADEYAIVYHQLKLGDPTAKVGCCGLIYITPDGQTCGQGECPWFSQFLVRARNQGADVDFYHVHDWFGRYDQGMYGGERNWGSLQRHLERVVTLVGRDLEIWITETAGHLGPGGTLQGEIAHMDALMGWLNSRPGGWRVDRVAWFSRYYNEGGLWAGSLVDGDQPDSPRGPVGDRWAATRRVVR